MECDTVLDELRKINRLTSQELRELQEKKLRHIVRHHYVNNEYYQNMLKTRGIHPSDISSVEDLQKLPVLQAEDISENFPFISVPREEVRRFLQTSGTTGKPKLIGYNKKDQERVAQIKARALLFSGVKKGEVFLSVMAYGPWASGLISQQGGEIVGLTIPADAKLGTKWHLWAINQYRPDYMVSLVSFLPRLLEECTAQGVEPANLGIKRMFVLGEMSSEKFRSHFESVFKTRIIDMYANTEFAVVASGCEHKRLHYWADELIVEILDPQTNEPCKPGERGQVVITGLSRESVPLIRYNTKDLAYVHEDQCECGSAFPTMSSILGRSDDMITISGANVFPSQIENAITSIPELSHLYNFIIAKEEFNDKITIKAELRPGASNASNLDERIFQNLIRSAPELEHAIMQAKTVARPQIILCGPGELSAGKWKIQKIFDERKET